MPQVTFNPPGAASCDKVSGCQPIEVEACNESDGHLKFDESKVFAKPVTWLAIAETDPLLPENKFMFDVLEMPWDISDPTRIGAQLCASIWGHHEQVPLVLFFYAAFGIGILMSSWAMQWLKGNEGNFGQITCFLK